MKKLISGFAAAILDYRKQLKMPKKCLLVAPTNSEKNTKALLLTSSGSAVVVKRSAWGYFYPLVLGRLNDTKLFNGHCDCADNYVTMPA
jgi:hypothetical protein